jgi:hypothetical protein
MSDNLGNQDVVCRSDEMFGIEQYAFLDGEMYEGWNEKFTFHFDPSEGCIPTDYLANDLGWLIVSERLREIFEDLEPGSIQYFPVSIINLKNGTPIIGYYVCNLLNHIDAIDLDNSDYTFFKLDEEEIYQSKNLQ